MGRFLKFGLIGIVVLGGVAIGAGLWLGIFDKRDLTTGARVQASRLASEVGQGISGIGSGTGAARGGTSAEAGQCRENLRRIESAKRAAGQRLNLEIGAVPEADVLRQLGGTLPVCPIGGVYTIGDLQVQVRCSVGGNGTNDPAYQHLLRNY